MSNNERDRNKTLNRAFITVLALMFNRRLSIKDLAAMLNVHYNQARQWLIAAEKVLPVIRHGGGRGKWLEYQLDLSKLSQQEIHEYNTASHNKSDHHRTRTSDGKPDQHRIPGL